MCADVWTAKLTGVMHRTRSTFFLDLIDTCKPTYVQEVINGRVMHVNKAVIFVVKKE